MAKDLVRASNYLREHPNRRFDFKHLAAGAIGYDRKPYQKILRKGVSSMARRMERADPLGLLCRIHDADKLNRAVIAIVWAMPKETNYERVTRIHCREIVQRTERRQSYAAGLKRAQHHLSCLPAGTQKEIKRQLELFQAESEVAELSA